ncbi:peptidoglycan DD-metalloendopeptidase family protein [Arthrobacter sp. GN70]|uniref:peptidoglycan DD-metalloendopeptidase family protein n=1 Tax=Arthrobacter sp. GN70 TaxID=2838876 RepID=UPI001BFDD4E5|nr:peptidoglycan DD-metalloendopeptidase family protein [Arthrobacter sp. GN70]MBT8162791.1 peptidoglycan DD-metalloendopeptidase family protein [Arthrobacter sp. GN70]
MPVIGVAEILVSPVFKDLQKKVGRELDGVGESAGASAGKGFGSKMVGAVGGFLSGTMKAAGIAGGLTVGGAFGVALAKGFGRLQAIEDAKAKLSGLGHSAETVQGIMNDAMAAVKGTAFGLDEAATVAAGAVAAGVQPGKELERTLKLTGDAATIAGVGMGEMGAIFNKVASSNKIQGDVIAQLNDAGIPIVQLLGKELGKTADETLKLASDGKINFETFQRAMEKGLGGAALKSGETLRGAFKNTMASVGRIGANLLSGVYPKIREFFSNAIQWLQPLEAGAKIAGAAIGDFLDKGLTGAKAIWDLVVGGDFTGKFREIFHVEEDSKLIDVIFKIREGAQGLYDLIVGGDYTGKLRKAFGWEEDSKLVGFILTVRDTVLKIPDALGKVISTGADVAKFLWDMRAPIGIIAGLIAFTLIPHWIALGVEAIASSVKQAQAWATSKGAAVKGAFTHSWAVTVMVAGWISLAAAAVNSAAITAAIWLMYQWDSVKAVAAMLVAKASIVGSWIAMAAQATVQAVKMAAAWVIALGPVGWAIGIIAALVAGFVWAYNNIGWFRDGVDAAMRWISDAVSVAFQWVQGVIAAVVDWFTGTAVPAWQSAIQAVGDFFGYLWTDWIKPALDGIAAAVTWVYESIIKPIFDGIVTAVGVAGAIFGWLYTNILKPVFDSTAVVLGGFYLLFRGIFQVIVSVIKNIIVPLIQWWWNTIFVPAFVGMGRAVADWWNGAVSIFNSFVGFIRDTLATAVNWLYDSVIKPVFDAIGSAINWVWVNVIKATFDSWVWIFTKVVPDALNWLYANAVQPVFTAIGDAVNWVWLNVLKPVFDTWVWVFTKVIPDAANWLYANAIKPVFDAIGTAANWVWLNVIKPVFDTWVWFFTKVIPDAANWLYQNAIKPVFDGIGSAIKWTWDNVIKPVFDFLSKAINEDIPKAFQTGVDAIKKIWDTILDIAKAPVKFVVNTVINDGLIGAFNTVAGILPGVDKLPRVALPDGFARGGVLPGRSSWRNGDDQLVPMRKGEGVYVSEVMQDPFERARLYFMNKAAIMGRKASEARAMFGDGFAKGGIVNPLRSMVETQGYNRVHKGIDLAASEGTPVFATEGGRVSWSGPGVMAPGVWGGNEIHIDGGSGIQTWFAHMSSMAVKVGEMVRGGQQIGLSGNTGITSGPHLHFGTFAGGWPNDIDPHGYLGGAGLPSGGGFNPLAGIIDGLLSQFKQAFPAAGIMADIAIGIGKKLFNTVSDVITGGGKGSAVGDPALYDLGGILPPGVSQVVNRTGKPEAILNPQQWDDIHRLALRRDAGGRGDVYFNGPVGWDPDEVANRIETKRRDTFSAFGI